MATLVPFTYKDDQGVIKTHDIDLEYESQITEIPEEFEHSITMTDVTPTTVTTDYVGPAPKRN